MRYALFSILMSTMAFGCSDPTRLATPVAVVESSDDAPWNKRYPTKPQGVSFGVLLENSFGAYVVQVGDPKAHMDPGGVFKEWTQAADGSTTLVPAKVEFVLAGPPIEALDLLLPGLADPVPGSALPSTMVPHVTAGQRAIVFVKANPQNPTWSLIAYHSEGYFPISKVGKASNGVLRVHPVKPEAQLLGEILASVAKKSALVKPPSTGVASAPSGDAYSGADSTP